MKKILSFSLAFVMLMTLITLGNGQTTKVSAEGKTYYYSVAFNNNNIPSDFQKYVKENGGEVVYSIPEVGFVQIKGNSSIFNKVKGLSSVEMINPSIEWKLPETQRYDAEEISEKNIDKSALASGAIDTKNVYFWNKQWDMQRLTNNGESYKLGTGSHNVIVGIIDTGIDRNHPALINNIMPGSKNFVPAGGYKGTEAKENGDINAFDDQEGHGSHVAGSIAGNGAILGVAPNTGIRSYRVFGTKSAESAWIIKAMVAAADDGVDVMSMSLGGFDVLGQIYTIDPETGEKVKAGRDLADYIAYKRAVKYVQDKGVLIVVAAGNDGIDCGNRKEVTNFLNQEYNKEGIYIIGASVNVPAVYPNVVTVSATGPKDIFALYSNYGAGFIDISAPGGDTRLYEEYYEKGLVLYYLFFKLFEKEWCLSTNAKGQYYWSVGTSMATPKVSAVAALIIDKYGKMAPNKVADILYKKGVDAAKGTDRANVGYGYLNAYNALK